MNSPVAIGSTIAGKYRVERVLGQGGMGVVVVAMHDELDQRVAIKFLLKNAAADSEWVARFSREAKAAARIKSEHAVKVYDVGKLETGAPYMVMEYLEGRDLQLILDERKTFPVSEAVEYVLQACEAIAEAHSAGVVHRDLKPANLFVTHRTDGSSCVKILDFGISKVSSLTGGDLQTVTNTAAIVGSPLYMSPEQMRASKNVDRRTDIWSLGVILQELVSGLPSFVANTTAELCALVLTAPPSPLGVIGAPPGLEAIITKCLAKKPEDRYATIAEFATALEPFGPSSVKMSVERIVRLAQSGSRAVPSSVSISEIAPVSIVPVGQSSNISSLGQTEMSEAIDAPTVPAAMPAPIAAGAGTAAAWGSSQPQSKRSRTPIIAAGAVLAALGVLAIIFVVASSHSNAKTNTQTNATNAQTNVTNDPSVPTVPVSVSAPVSVSVSSASASAPVSVSVSVPVSASVSVSTGSHTTTRPTATVSAKKIIAPVDTTGFGGRN